MRSIIINSTLSLIKKHNDISDVKLAEVKYGLECIYILLSKTFVIVLIAYLLGILEATLWVLLFTAIIRLFSFGVHSSKSWVCLVVSVFIYIVFPYLCTLIMFPASYIYIGGAVATFLIYIYSPADTKKRPIRSKKRRMVYKYTSTLIALVYYCFAIYYKNTIVSNYLITTLVLQSLFVLPVTYKAFKEPYANYRNIPSL